MTDRTEIKESAAQERRQWVRLTKQCNNRCLFCLDSDAQDGSRIPSEQVAEQIKAGAGEGARRLILSGGEPTIHPDFLQFVALGRRLGYGWIQTITNGRLFSYRAFADRVLRAGLNEATFSMHGHTPELHDRLVGVEGAFKQALAGMKNLLGRCVVNVDVALNRLNVPHLRELLEFYIDLGITEFDLLHTVPFGLAWRENRELLFYDPREFHEHLRRAFELRHRPGLIFWTNRLPAPYLEGAEDLIQDPYKIHDEVRGRREHFENWIDRNEPLPCLGDRCSYCFLNGFCETLQATLDTLSEAREQVAEELWLVDADRRFAGAPVPGGLRLPRRIRLVLHADSAKAATGWLEAAAARPAALELVPSGPWSEAWTDLIAATDRIRLEAEHWDSGTAEGWLTALERFDDVELSLPAVAGLSEEELARQGRRLHLPRRLLLTEASELDLALDDLNRLARAAGCLIDGLPACLAPGAANPPERPGVNLRLLDENGRLDMVRYTNDYVRNHYQVKSHRCSACARDAICAGLQITAARRLGLTALAPMED